MEGEEDILQKHHQHRLIIDEGPPPETRSSTFDDADDKQPPPPAKTKRVASLDIFRGLTVAMMVLVDGAGGEWPAIGHAPWEGCNLADFVMPFFLFIVGMAVPLSLKRIPNRLLAAKRVVLTFKDREAHFLGSSFARVDMQQIRRCGILQRIALAYLIVALLEISTKNTQSESQSHTTSSIFKSYLWQWSAGACILIVYLAMLYDMYVPNWEFTVHNSNSKDYGKVLTVACGVRGQLDPPCNAVGHIDRTVLGINHMYHHPAWRRTKACTDVSPHEGPIRVDAPSWCQAPFEPEGILSSISSIMTTIIGVHFGHVLVHIKDHTQRLRHWVLMGFALLISEIILHFTSASAGAVALVFSSFYILVDMWGLRNLFLPMEWIGMNAMLLYVMAAEGVFEGFINGWYYDDPHKTLVYWIKKHIFIGLWHSKRVGILLYILFAQILFWALVAGILHQLGIYWKL